MLKLKIKNKKGFTLIELIVVIAIIGILMAILIPSLMGYITNAKVRQVENNAKTAYNAVAAYYTNSVADNENFIVLAEDEDKAAYINETVNAITSPTGELGSSWKGKIGVAYTANEHFVAVWSKNKASSVGSNKKYTHSSGNGTWAAYPLDVEWSGNIYWGS